MFRYPSTWLIAASGAVSCYTVWGGLLRHGYFSAVEQLWNTDLALLPASQNPILTTYTMIPPLDKLITFSVILFTNITDGSTPQFSLFAFHFTGQWASILTVIFAEEIKRDGHGKGLMVSMSWLLFLQSVTYACGMPVYSLYSIWRAISDDRSKTKMSVGDIPGTTAALNILPWSIALGYGVPTVLMSIPFENNKLHQWFNGLWQGHPLWIVMIQLFIESLQSRSSSLSPSMPTSRGDSMHTALNSVYGFAFGTAGITHIASLAIVGTRTFFPMLFSELGRETITWQNTYQPMPFWRTASSMSMPLVVLDFFQYDLYCGSITSIIWASSLYSLSRISIPSGTTKERIWMALKSMSVGLLAGPSCLPIYILSERDKDHFAFTIAQEKED